MLLALQKVVNEIPANKAGEIVLKIKNSGQTVLEVNLQLTLDGVGRLREQLEEYAEGNIEFILDMGAVLMISFALSIIDTVAVLFPQLVAEGDALIGIVALIEAAGQRFGQGDFTVTVHTTWSVL